MFLMIENPGAAPLEAFTVLGLSSADNYSGPNADLIIGQFGSGNKHAVNVLLRNSINPTVYCGRERLEFYSTPKAWDNGSYAQVCCNKQELGFVLDYGKSDWLSVDMALREFVSNSIDRTIRETGGFDQVVVKVVDKTRAKSGYTRVFVPLTSEVQRFFNELHKRFLHFSEPESLRSTVLRKRGRNLTGTGAMVYKKGVFIREVGQDSIYDYNFNDLQLDECRNVDDWKVSDKAALTLRSSTAEIIGSVYTKLLSGLAPWESKLRAYSLCPSNIFDSEERSLALAQWESGWRIAAGEALLEEGETLLGDRARRKGFIVKSLQGSWAQVKGPRRVLDVLSDHEQNGREITEPTPEAILAVNTVWDYVVGAGMTKGHSRPPVRGYNCVYDAGIIEQGFYKDGVVYINNDIGGVELFETALEEIVHYVTGSTDNSSDFQNYLIKMVIKNVCD